MRLSPRLIALLATGMTVVTLVITWYDVRTAQIARRLSVQERAASIAGHLQDIVEPLLQPASAESLVAAVEKMTTREHLAGVAIYDMEGRSLAISSALARDGQPDAMARCGSFEGGCGEFITSAGRPLYVYTTPLRRNQTIVAALTTFSDPGANSSGRGSLWRFALARVVPQILLIALVTIGVVQMAVLRPIARTARWMRDIRVGGATAKRDVADRGLLEPISAEAASLALSLASARATAQEEARLREAGDSLWTAERLRVGIQGRLRGNRLFVVSNREPYEHVRRGAAIEALVPASGLVTALEPILYACDGTWIAHGSGDADHEVVDARGRVRVPPDDPHYTLRRVWLTREEEEGYYSGFSNEGLWPLCHVAFTRPIFRASDWDQYQRVNQTFARVLLEEIEHAEQPFLLVQDYHFALLPRFVKDVRPDARIAVFWHIPWPNPEAFGICPWQREILDGLLGADIVGFHIQAHCSNFLRSVDRSLECRIEWERSAVNRRGHVTVVRPHPISVAFGESLDDPGPSEPFDEERVLTRRSFGVRRPGCFLGVGVDRVDYTKGIVERFRAIECLLEKEPDYAGRFTFVQVGAPSRTHIKRYQDLVIEVGLEAARVNRRFETGDWKPIVLLDTHHNHDQIERLYRAADVCLVTSLHDGMNLVAKEFVASRTDEDGVLVLSQFAGASCELRDALLVNPYDVGQLADAIRTAIEMPRSERRARMRHMRRIVREHNVYRWAADLVSELAEVRLEAAEPAVTV